MAETEGSNNEQRRVHQQHDAQSSRNHAGSCMFSPSHRESDVPSRRGNELAGSQACSESEKQTTARATGSQMKSRTKQSAHCCASVVLCAFVTLVKSS